MPTPITDPNFSTGCYVFGYTLPGRSYWGNARTYNQQAIWGTRSFGNEIPRKNQEEHMLEFLYGPPYPEKRGKWATLPFLCLSATGPWAQRVIFYKWRNKPHIRRYTPWDGKAKETAVPGMLKLMESSFIWSCLTDEAKARLEADATRTGQATQGHNYFTKLYIKDDPRWQTYV